MPRTAPPTLTIRIDTREQNPFTFSSVLAPVLPFTTVRGNLPTGDYGDDSRVSLPHAAQCIVERKSLADLYHTMGRGRDRFERECERMASYGYAAIVIEASWEQICRPNHYLRHPTALNPKSVILSLMAFSQRYGVHVQACPGRKFAEQLTHRLIERWARDYQTTGDQSNGTKEERSHDRDRADDDHAQRRQHDDEHGQAEADQAD